MWDRAETVDPYIAQSAIGICRTCPVRQECTAFAESTKGQPFPADGIYGGLMYHKGQRDVDDLTGRQYGQLTVLWLNDTPKHKGRTWLCRCTCGNEVEVSSSRLRNGIRTTCGCGAGTNMVGRVSGHLTVLSLHKNRTWLCQCKCGERVLVAQSYLSGRRSSCGCKGRGVAA